MSGVFLIRGSGDLVEMSETPYDSEAMLQELLARYPNLLTSDAHNGGSARRWMLLSREVSLTSVGGTSGAWSVDHLFVDQEGVPTLVEVKRSNNSEIRRSVVGQMLDYAANAVVYWPVDRLRATFEANALAASLDPEKLIGEVLLDGVVDIDAFWQKVATNLQAQRIRLVFVADEIPSELARVIEFLNGQMASVEVVGIEVKQYVGEDLKTLVPRVIGRTEQAVTRKGGGRTQLRDDWSWALYGSELNIAATRIEVGRALVEAVEAAVALRSLPWTTAFRKGYVVLRRPPNTKVAVIDLWWRKVPRFAVKLPKPPDELGLSSPYPELPEDWDPSEREWGWTVRALDQIPDVGAVLNLIQPFHSGDGTA